MNYYQVAVNYPVYPGVLTYGSESDLDIGTFVKVPLGRRQAKGIIWKIIDKKEIEFDLSKIKPVSQVTQEQLKLGQLEVEMYNWMSSYYHYSLGKLVFDCLPKFLKRPRKVEFVQGENKDFEFELNPDQKEVSEAISKDLFRGFKQFLIHGVTGSGKSVIYLDLMKQVFESGKSVQFLLPEINLTPQFVEMFSKYTGVKILKYHSSITPSEKFTLYQELKKSEESFLILGVRSSVFLPCENLGLIIVDEEHDSSFKQNDRCPYHGRDMAIKKAHLYNIPVVLGSATPSIESYYRFKNKGGYFSLNKRALGSFFPKLVLIDKKRDDKSKKVELPYWPFYPETLKKIETKLNEGEQVLIFINKLGYSQFLQCRNCGFKFVNKDCGCENSLRYFKAKCELSCSYCEYKCVAPTVCPECSSVTIQPKGFGTEKVTEMLKSALANYKIGRFDRDEIKNFKDMQQRLEDFNKKEIDVLVGTQMLSKGHNFRNVNLVVILGFDHSLGMGDYKASEKAFSSLVQVAGRAGRYSDSSEVVVQTLVPDHQLFSFYDQKFLDSFYEYELPHREFANCSPYVKMCSLFVTSRFRERVVKTSGMLVSNLEKTKNKNNLDVDIIGPTPSFIEKRAHEYTWVIVLRSSKVSDLHSLLEGMARNQKNIPGVSIKIDLDPDKTL